MLKNFLLSAFFAILTAVGGLLSIPMPPIPFTLQVFFVLMSGLLLGPKYGPLSQILYIAMGLIGLPVFAGGRGGLQHVLSPSFGFLIGFVAASWLAGFLVFGKGTKRDAKPGSRLLFYVLVCVAASAFMYVVALPCFYFNMKYVMNTPIGFVRMFEVAMIPFLIPDLIKAGAAGALASQTIPILRDAGLLPK
jgi:biotin transport system substrate-specific component